MSLFSKLKLPIILLRSQIRIRQMSLANPLVADQVPQDSRQGRFLGTQFKVPGDHPTIGLILCSDKSEAVAKYSILNEGRQIFYSKYLQFLPSEQELMKEIERERKLIEAAIEEAAENDEPGGNA